MWYRMIAVICSCYILLRDFSWALMCQSLMLFTSAWNCYQIVSWLARFIYSGHWIFGTETMLVLIHSHTDLVKKFSNTICFNHIWEMLCVILSGQATAALRNVNLELFSHGVIQPELWNILTFVLAEFNRSTWSMANMWSATGKLMTRNRVEWWHAWRNANFSCRPITWTVPRLAPKHFCIGVSKFIYFLIWTDMLLIMFNIQASRLVREPWVFWRHLF